MALLTNVSLYRVMGFLIVGCRRGSSPSATHGFLTCLAIAAAACDRVAHSGGNGAQGGAGGVSLGIAFTGMAPVVDGTPVSTSMPTLAGVTVATTATAGGTGGSGGSAIGTTSGSDGGAGHVGLAQAIMGF